VIRPNPLTVGQYLAEAQKHLEVRPKTFAAYAAVLRRIAADIAGLESDNAHLCLVRMRRIYWLLSAGRWFRNLPRIAHIYLEPTSWFSASVIVVQSLGI